MQTDLFIYLFIYSDLFRHPVRVGQLENTTQYKRTEKINEYPFATSGTSDRWKKSKRALKSVHRYIQKLLAAAIQFLFDYLISSRLFDFEPTYMHIYRGLTRSKLDFNES